MGSAPKRTPQVFHPNKTRLEIVKDHPNNDSPEIEKVQCGIIHYDEVIFPKVEAGERTFNWWAGLFPAYWLAYKGLWVEFVKWVVPYAIASSLLDFFGLTIQMIGLQVGIGVALGFEANQKYYLYCKENLRNSSSKLEGLGGALLFSITFGLTAAFATGFVKGFKNSTAKPDVQQGQTPSGSPISDSSKVPSKNLSRVEVIHNQLRLNNAEAIRLGIGAIGYPDEKSSEEVWLKNFFPLCQNANIPADDCKEETLEFRKKWIMDKEAAEKREKLKKLKAENEKHQNAIKLGYENDPFVVALSNLLREDFKKGVPLGTYLKKYVPNLEENSANITQSEYGALSIEFEVPGQGPLKYSMFGSRIDELRKKDFNGILFWAPDSDLAKQAFKELTGFEWVDFRAARGSYWFPKASFIENINKLGYNLQEQAGYNSDYFNLEEWLVVDSQNNEGNGIVNGPSDRSRSLAAEVRLSRSDFSVYVKGDKWLDKAKSISSVIFKTITPNFEYDRLFEACIREQLDIYIKGANNEKGLTFTCAPYLQLKISIFQCRSYGDNPPCGGPGLSYSLSEH